MPKKRAVSKQGVKATSATPKRFYEAKKKKPLGKSVMGRKK